MRVKEKCFDCKLINIYQLFKPFFRLKELFCADECRSLAHVSAEAAQVSAEGLCRAESQCKGCARQRKAALVSAKPRSAKPRSSAQSCARSAKAVSSVQRPFCLLKRPISQRLSRALSNYNRRCQRACRLCQRVRV